MCKSFGIMEILVGGPCQVGASMTDWRTHTLTRCRGYDMKREMPLSFNNCLRGWNIENSNIDKYSTPKSKAIGYDLELVII